MALTERPEPMNAITSHPKVKVSITVSDSTFVAGKYVSGKMEMECRADKGLGIGVIMVELFGIQGSLTSVVANRAGLDSCLVGRIVLPRSFSDQHVLPC
jgi:hypothetical protein